MKQSICAILAAFLMCTGLLTGTCGAAAATAADSRDVVDRIVENFKLLAQVPRPSHHEEKISAFLENWAGKQGFKVARDKQNNLMFHVPATPGLEELPLTILQGHMDMVCAAKEGVRFDPLKDPIKVIRDDQAGTLTADGTSLGGDDGIGVAMIMLIAQGGMEHGPLRVIITTDEEDGMEGAQGLSRDWLAGASYLINLDNEDSNEVLVSTAAGDSVKATGTVNPVKPAGDTFVRLELKGLKGGHSGVEINKGRCNGIIAMGKLLQRIREAGVGYDLIVFQGGTAANAIPAKAEAVLAIRAADRPGLADVMDQYRAGLEARYKGIEDSITLTLSDAAAADQALSAADRDRVLVFVNGIIDGVHTWSADMKGLVESSSNMGLFTADKKGIFARTYVRSSSGKWETKIVNSQVKLAKKSKFKTEIIKMADPWPYNPGSRLLALTKQAYKKLNGEEVKVVAVHAGLECGTFAVLNPKLDMISLGPDVKDPHTPQETIYLRSLPKTWNLVKELLKQVR